MAHSVTLRLPDLEIRKTDAIFFIHQDSEKIGEVRISKGILDYYPSGRKKPIEIKWAAFDKMVKESNGE